MDAAVTTLARSSGWVGGSVFGLAVGGFVFHFPGSFGEPVWSPMAMGVGALFGAITGAVVGLCQWVGLGAPRGRLLRLMGAMAFGVGVTHALADGSAASIGLFAVALIGGTAVALGNIWAFRATRPVWVAASVLGWAGGWLLGERLAELWRMPWTQTPIGWAQEHLVVGVVVGIVWGVATAASGLPTWIVAERPASRASAGPTPPLAAGGAR